MIYLQPKHRNILIISLLAAWLSGLVWFFFDVVAQQRTPAIAREIHGAAAMLALIALGSLYEHIRVGWNSKRNFTSGILVVLALIFIIVTSWMLYYVGDEFLRKIASVTHWGIGVLALFLVIFHGFRRKFINNK